MNRFSVIYLLKKQYYHIYCSTQEEAESVLQHMLTQEDCKPVGIYDAKTELFYWEPARQLKYNKARIEEQGKLGNHIISIAQHLRHRNEEWEPKPNSISQLLHMNDVSPTTLSTTL